jgi:hypothetical protein
VRPSAAVLLSAVLLSAAVLPQAAALPRAGPTLGAAPGRRRRGQAGPASREAVRKEASRLRRASRTACRPGSLPADPSG